MDPNQGNGTHNSAPDGKTKQVADPSTEQNNPLAETKTDAGTQEKQQPESMDDVVAAALKNQPDASGPDDKSDETQKASQDEDDKDDKDGEKLADTSKSDEDGDDDANKGTDDDEAKSKEASSESDEKSDNKDEDELPDEPDENELKQYNAKVKRRIKKLLDQRYEARTEAAELRPDAEAYREIQTFMTENDLKSEDVQQLFSFGQKLRQGEFEEALKIAQPYVQLLMQGAGRAVPNDLRPRVDAGEITEEMAREVAKERVNAHYAQERVERQKERDQQQQLSTADKAIRDAADAWEDAKRQVDPDFEAKAATMKAFAVQLVQQYGSPRTPDEAKLLAEDAYKLTNEQFANMRPAKQPTRPEASSGSQQSSGSKAAPGSLEDAIRQGLEAAGHS